MAPLKFLMPSPKPFASSGIFFPPNSRTATTKMTISSGKPIDRNMRPPLMDHTLNNPIVLRFPSFRTRVYFHFHVAAKLYTVRKSPSLCIGGRTAYFHAAVPAGHPAQARLDRRAFRTCGHGSGCGFPVRHAARKSDRRDNVRRGIRSFPDRLDRNLGGLLVSAHARYRQVL